MGMNALPDYINLSGRKKHMKVAFVTDISVELLLNRLSATRQVLS